MTNKHRREVPELSQAEEARASRDLPEGGAPQRVDDPDIIERVDTLIEDVCEVKPRSFDRRLVRDLVTTALKLIPDGRDTGELKLMTAAMKELRYAYRIFGEYPDPHKVTIFGSARTPEDHPDYLAAVELGRMMAKAGWMVITGAGDGIMKAGHVGPGREASFGVAIRLPFETTANDVIKGDQKLINFRYFFTRKLMFLSQAEAVVCFPGGFGTMDEAFETLTLIQTGKATMVPIILVEGQGEPYQERPVGGYWQGFDEFIKTDLLARGMINPEDTGLYEIVATPAEAAERILKYYRNYHSSRYVYDDLVIRMKRQLTDEAMAKINDEFAVLVKEGKIEQRGPFEAEREFLELPRIAFTHTRRNFGLVRRLIDRVNELETVEAVEA